MKNFGFVPPLYGEHIPLLCLKCKKMFVGPNPKGEKLFEELIKRKKAKCPNCGSKNVIPHPGVHW